MFFKIIYDYLQINLVEYYLQNPTQKISPITPILDPDIVHSDYVNDVVINKNNDNYDKLFDKLFDKLDKIF